MSNTSNVTWSMDVVRVTRKMSRQYGTSHRSSSERPIYAVESSWNVMANGDAREGKWRGNWQTEWVASTLHTTSEHVVSSITTADAHTSAASSRLNWSPPADLNVLVLFAQKRYVVSARVPSHFKRSLPLLHQLKQSRLKFVCVILLGTVAILECMFDSWRGLKYVCTCL